MIPGSVTVETVSSPSAASAPSASESAPNSKSAAGAAPLRELHVHTADIDIYLFLDGAHRLTRISVPASNAEIVRE